MRLFVVFFLIILFSCQASSLEEFQYDGAKEVKLLVEELKSIETREDLFLVEASIEKRFAKIVDIIIQARLFQQKHPGAETPVLQIGQVMSQALLEEMKRIYSLEGGRECLERAQREAMLKLDAKEKAFAKSLQGSHFN